MRLLAVVAVTMAAYAQAPIQVQFQCSPADLDIIGQGCSNSDSCPVYLELSNLDVVGPKLFISGNLHTETSTLSSILLASDDGGKTWSEPHERIRSAGLDQIQFIDFETGWIAGEMLLGTPKDPFLLITQDGGKAWRLQPLFEESHPGMIEQFWFESRTSGALVIDRVQPSETGARHELYESMTGGTSWLLREAGASPIQLKRFRTPSQTGWRLRADASSKTYRVERQEAGRWTAMATFPVRIGECKPSENMLAEPGADKPEAEPATKEDDPKPAGSKPVRKRSLKRKAQ